MTPAGPHFACSRCAHRQADDVACAGCGNAVVQDLRDPDARRMLYDAESRWRSAWHRRATGFGAVVLMVTLVPAWIVLKRPGWAMMIAGTFAGSVVGALEVRVARRRRFPYLDEYEYGDQVPTRRSS